MRFSVLLALASGLLTHALHTGTNTSLNAVNSRPEWTPDLPYPAGYSSATCPLRPGPNSFCPLEALGWKKRSVPTATYLRRRTEACRQIKRCIINNHPRFFGYTQEVLVIKGVTYVFSWTLNPQAIYVEAWRKDAVFQTAHSNTGTGTMTLNIDQTGYVYFRIYGPLPPPSGEIALFQIGPG